MYERAKFRRKLFIAVGAALCLIFGAVITWAAFPSSGSSPAQNFANTHKTSSHLVLHGVGFDNSGKLDDGSRAVLDEAAELLKEDPDATVSVDQRRAADPNASCGLTPAQTQAVARYIEGRGVPAARLVLCQAQPVSITPQQ